MRAQRAGADAGIPGMDEYLFVLRIPGIEGAPAETSRAGRPGNRVLAGYPDGIMTLHAARAQAMPMRRPLPCALVVLIAGEEAHADVAGRDAALADNASIPLHSAPGSCRRSGRRQEPHVPAAAQARRDAGMDAGMQARPRPAAVV